MSRTKNRRNRRVNPLRAVEAARRIGDLVEGVKPEIIDAGPVRHPIYVYMDGKWVVAEKETGKFPFPVLQQVTPEWAFDVLTERNTNNRKRDKRLVAKYASDIFNKHWHVINNGVGFFEDGTLADGQHRLEAVVETGITVPMIAVYGIDPDAMVAIDEGRPRSNTDVGKMLGLDISPAAMSASNYILEYSGAKEKLSRTELLEFYNRHETSITEIFSYFNKKKVKGVTIAPVMAVLIRAWYTEDRDRLQEFANILISGMFSDADDKAAGVLRTFLMTKMDWNTGPARASKYRKTESALIHFLNGHQIDKLFGLSDEQFKVPETICKIN